ncbi:MAG: DUF4124 domain-containing protein [Zoogloeaceae bacterium]|nr:DUF4124 domain-containing protein [Zoogloeaceae bacterium]
MKILWWSGFLLLGSVAAFPAWGQVYKCVDADDHVTYSNVMSKQGSKQCTRMELTPDNSMSAPKPVRGKATTTTRIPGSAATPGFPSVGDNEHKARENDRRAILEQELSAELQNLSQAQKALAEQQTRKGDTKTLEASVTLHKRNVDALQKEIANLK